MSKPTRTPWSVGGPGNGGGSTMGVYCDDATGNRIADCHPQFSTIDRGEARANAVLMAAAPELLAALKALDNRGHTAATWQAAKEAIAKAEKH
tara:strand:+ start:162 stop:440 length:279 start_codon:yes stop_codon:yes gene_type:complete